jgi:hypothetical protein
MSRKSSKFKVARRSWMMKSFEVRLGVFKGALHASMLLHGDFQRRQRKQGATSNLVGGLIHSLKPLF